MCVCLMFSREGVFTTIVYLVIAGGYAVEDALSNNTVRRDSCHVSRNFLIEAENLHFLARRGLSTPLRTLWRTRKRLPTWRSPFTTLRSCLFVFPIRRYCRTTKTMLCINFAWMSQGNRLRSVLGRRHSASQATVLGVL